MFDDFVGAGAEAAAGAEGPGEGADDHVDVDGVDVGVFGKATGCAAEDAEGEGFVKDEAEFVLLFKVNLARFIFSQSMGPFDSKASNEESGAGDVQWEQTYHSRQIKHVAHVFKQSLSDDEAAG